MPLYKTSVSQRKKQIIRHNAATVATMLGPNATVLHTSETGKIVTEIEEASHMTGVYKAVAPYRQLYVLQVIRYWVELLGSLQYLAMEAQAGREEIPFFTEVFRGFRNKDSYLKTRKTWDSLP